MQPEQTKFQKLDEMVSHLWYKIQSWIILLVVAGAIGYIFFDTLIFMAIACPALWFLKLFIKFIYGCIQEAKSDYSRKKD